MNCDKRGFHRISLMDFICVECGQEFTATEVVQNELKKIAAMGPPKGVTEAGG